MALPTIAVAIAFTTNPASTPSWTDVTTYVAGFTYNRGRSHELENVQAGTASVMLDNRDRRFDPTYASSPYSPNVRPMRRLRIQAVWSAVTYDLFHGYIEAWPLTYSGADTNVSGGR